MNYPGDITHTQFKLIEKYFLVERDPRGRKKRDTDNINSECNILCIENRLPMDDTSKRLSKM